MEKDIYRSQFRLPYDLYEKLKKSADANSRSLNAELILRLEASFILDEQQFLSPENIHKALWSSADAARLGAKSLFDDVEFKSLLSEEVQKELDRRLNKDSK